ncbi:TolC family protein [Flavisolibacter ginsengisoli]|jgi:outer membrane protein TolC|uniref:Outer membrane protein TolC n=1 Tax=Flavisolibacter ginsengisoli DSM 18119 TaxID=1121884 RepID=A0A1M4UC02_9BACT|nr:TolC family protein [Flavisolibacter ginsengisoli]SHE54332.1 Outer membrane protein TolC [Flavisolibacter ginsengisoli DSM 18119]
MRFCCILLLIILFKAGYAQTHTLDYFLQNAKQNSPGLKDFQNQVLSLQIDSQLLKASLGPQVNFLSNNSYAPIINGWGYDEAITNRANISGLIQASRNYLSRGQISAQYRTIALQRRSLLDTIALSQQDLARTITEQYIAAYGDLLAMDFNREVYDLMQREEQALKKLTQANVYKQTDYLTFYVTMQQQELTWLQAQIQYNNDFLTLNYLSGLVDTTIERIEKPALTDSLGMDFYNTVFYSRFITDSLRLANEKDLVNFEYKPRIGAYTDAGYNSSLQNTPYKNFGLSAGVSVTIPIYDGRQKQMKLARIDIQERTRQSNREFYVNQHNMQLLQLKQQLLSIDLMVEKINKQIGYAHTLIVANGKLLQTGDITMKDYVTAINNYLQAQNLLTQNNINRLKILNQVNYWNVKP